MINIDHLPNALSTYQVVLKPDKNMPEWWAGAPSVVISNEGKFYLAARMREGNSPRGRRGYEIRILESDDGIHFTTIKHIKREDAKVPGFERPALIKDPKTGSYKLYACAALKQGWSVLKFNDAAHPSEFNQNNISIILAPEQTDDEFVHILGYKDPVIFRDHECWHMFVTAFDRIERIAHYTSDDGEKWKPVQNSKPLENCGWHNFYTRPASVLTMTIGYLFIYEGSHVTWYDPVYNIATGIAYSPDLKTFIDVTPHQPLLKSSTPGDYHTWRYSHWIKYKEKLFVYFEAACQNNTNELRVAVINLDI
jgi:hypothetical protein